MRGRVFGAVAVVAAPLLAVAGPAGATPLPPTTLALTTSATTQTVRSCTVATGSANVTCGGYLGATAVGALVTGTGVTGGTTARIVTHTPHTSYSTLVLSSAVSGASGTETLTLILDPTGAITSGHPVRYTATVTPSGPHTPTGTVSWSITGVGGTAVCSDGTTVTKLNSHGVAVCDIPAGVLVARATPYIVHAVYGGDPNNARSTGTFTQAISKVATKTYVSGSPITPAVHAAVKFTAAVVPGKYGTTPGGTITFNFGAPGGAGTITCTGGNIQTMAGGDATCSLPAGLSVAGTYVVQAVYTGDGDSLASATCPVTRTMPHPEMCGGHTRSVKFKLK